MKVSEIAELLRGTPAGDAGREILGVASLETAGPAELAYVESPRVLGQAAASGAGCLLVPEGASLPGHTTISVRHPKLALIRAAEALHPVPTPPPGVHPAAVVAADAQLAADCSVGPNVVIEGGVTVGAGTRLCPGVFLGAGVSVGRKVRLASPRYRLSRRANWGPGHSSRGRGDWIGRLRIRLGGRAARKISPVGKDCD